LSLYLILFLLLVVVVVVVIVVVLVVLLFALKSELFSWVIYIAVVSVINIIIFWNVTLCSTEDAYKVSDKPAAYRWYPSTRIISFTC